MIVKVDKAKYEIHKAAGTLDRYRGILIASELDHRGYDINYQIAITMDRDTKPEEYARYQEIREEVKAYIDAQIAEIDQGG
jgi:hypothetical protein